MRKANYHVVKSTPEELVINDDGPYEQFSTVTNAVEDVVEELSQQGLLPAGRRLFYYDSEDQLDEIIIENGKFVRFAPGPR